MTEKDVFATGGIIPRPTDEEMLARLWQSHHYLLPARIFSNSPLNAETLTATIKKAQEAQAAAEPVFEQGTLVGASNRAVWAQAVKTAAARGLKVSPTPFFAPIQPDKQD